MNKSCFLEVDDFGRWNTVADEHNIKSWQSLEDINVDRTERWFVLENEN